METKKYRVFATLKRMIQHMKQEDPAQFARIAVFTLLAAAYPFMAVFLPKIAIGILEKGGETAAKELVITMAVYLVIAGTLAVGSTYLRNYICIRNMRIRLNYIGKMTARFMHIDYHYHENAAFWEKYQKGLAAGNGNNMGIEGVYNKMFEIPAKLLTLLGMVFLAATLNPVILLALVGHVLTLMWVSAKTHDYEYSKKEETSKALRRIGYFQKTTQDFSLGKDIRIFNLGERIMRNYKDEIDAYIRLLNKIKNREFLLGILGIVTLFVTNVLMYGILIREVLNGMPVSSFTMYVTMITSLMTIMMEFGQDITYIRNEGEYVHDFYEFLDASLVEEGNGELQEVLAASGAVEIVFDDVTFRYPGTEKNIFDHFNFTIHAGERLAIVGVNGAGKSTLVKLMTGLFTPTEGHIYVNGTDIATLKKSELYKLYSAVFQKVNVLAFTIRENVGQNAADADDVRIQTALEKVGLKEKVEHFEKGLDQMLLKIIDENGTDFSGGERQKLAIARALYKDAAVVIMDEPTAALDALAEAEIYEDFSTLIEGKTAVYISHRLASTRFCDKIALLDENGLAEYGNHEELMALGGKYYEMFVVQGKYYQEEIA